MRRGEFAGGGFDDRLVGVAANGGGAGPGDHVAAALADDLREPARDLGVVDDAGLGHMHRGDARAVRLNFAEPLRSNPLAANAVGRAIGERASSCGNSFSSTATITLPQMSKGMPSREQNSSIAALPVRQFCARSEPGR